MIRQLQYLILLVLGFAGSIHRASAGTEPEVGDPAPRFTLSMATKDTIIHNGFSLESRIGKGTIVLAFYPANWSGGCTKEMCTLRDNFSDLATLGVEVYGISGDYVYSHREWAKALGLQFALLSDHMHEVARQYASFNAETGYNKRTVYVIDRQGRVAYVDLNYNVRTPDSFNALKAALALLR